MTHAEQDKQRGPPPPVDPREGGDSSRGEPGGRGGGADKTRRPTRDRKPGEERKS